MQPKFSEGQDESELTEALDALVQNGWKLDEEESGVRKTYYLKTYTKVMVGRSNQLVKPYLSLTGPSPYYWREKQGQESPPRDDFCRSQVSVGTAFKAHELPESGISYSSLDYTSSSWSLCA